VDVINVATILVVEDDREIAQLVRDYLERAGFETAWAGDGDQALQQARIVRPDLIVLDLGLPKRDGFDVIREIRKTAQTPIVILTARGEETDRVVGLELGADDYIVKPFSPREVVARVRAVLRRASAPEGDVQILRRGMMEIDIPRMRVSVNDHPVELTATEFQLLATMARRPGQVFTRGQLLDAVRGDAFEGYERAIDAHIKNLRRKIEPDGSGSAKPVFIQTVYGVGYRFAED
jgi:two-component system alkaline phosphatase synthesis response regulator PhoP